MKQNRIAFYGKGGIGKTSIASNVAAMLGKKGKKVLFIGCDPKADSCINLTGKRIPNVLNLSYEFGSDLKAEDIIFSGVYGVSCIEAGGPNAGSGCAGMGFNIMMSELERLNILKQDWDVIIYDVLGDVVCNGFSIPMRNNFVDKIFVVSTSQYMAIYAANNIINSAVNLSVNKRNIVGGMILNKHRDKKDSDIAEIYCAQTGLKLISEIKEDISWGLAECAGKVLCDIYPDSYSTKQVEELSDAIINCPDYDAPTALNVSQLDDFKRVLLNYYEGN